MHKSRKYRKVLKMIIFDLKWCFFGPPKAGRGLGIGEEIDKSFIEQRTDHYIRIDQAHQNRG